MRTVENAIAMGFIADDDVGVFARRVGISALNRNVNEAIRLALRGPLRGPYGRKLINHEKLTNSPTKEVKP